MGINKIPERNELKAPEKITPKETKKGISSKKPILEKAKKDLHPKKPYNPDYREDQFTP
ncbi:MAG: hypothetical protein HYU63_05965 [Armatimonadetes bacterium]|nr:hypothetical protein [Armatimonadota bacterium]